MIECAKCGKPLEDGDKGGPVARICAGIMGDEYIESWYFCDDCATNRGGRLFCSKQCSDFFFYGDEE